MKMVKLIIRLYFCISLLFFAGLLQLAGAIGVEIPRPIDMFLLIDQSGSMKKTDPEGVRVEASRYLASFLAAHRTDVFDHRLGVINFGTTAPESEMLPLASLLGANLDLIKKRVIPLDLGDTSFISALQRASQEFKKEKERLDRQKAIVIFTDGEPYDPRKLSKEGYFQEIREFIYSELKDTAIYIVAIDATGSYWPKDKGYWNAIVGGRTFSITQMEERALDKIYGSIVMKLLKAPEIRWDNVPPEGLEVEIEPYLERVTFSIIKENPDVELVIIRENGQKLSKDPSVYSSGRLSEVYTVVDPSPGIWKYKIEKGKGKVEVGKAIIPVAVRFLSPISPHPKGKPMKIVASFLKRDGSPVKEHPAYRLWLGASLTTPEGQKHSVEFGPGESGIYTGKQTVEAKAQGDYLFTLVMKGGNLIISQVQIPISVLPIPYFAVTKPQSGSQFALNAPVPVEAQLLMEGEPADPTTLFSDNPQSLLWAQLVDPKGKAIESTPLSYAADGSGKFAGTLEEVRKKGPYKLIFHLAGNLRIGKYYKATPEEVIFYKVPSAGEWLLGSLYWIIPGLLLIAGAFYGGYRATHPPLTGYLYVRFGSEENEYNLRTFGHKATIGRGCKIALDRDPEITGRCGFIKGMRKKSEEGVPQVVPEIHYLPSLESKTYEVVKLHDGDTVMIGGYIIEYRE